MHYQYLYVFGVCAIELTLILKNLINADHRNSQELKVLQITQILSNRLKKITLTLKIGLLHIIISQICCLYNLVTLSDGTST